MKFKVGQKVKVVARPGSSVADTPLQGQFGTITRVDSGLPFPYVVSLPKQLFPFAEEELAVIGG